MHQSHWRSVSQERAPAVPALQPTTEDGQVRQLLHSPLRKPLVSRQCPNRQLQQVRSPAESQLQRQCSSTTQRQAQANAAALQDEMDTRILAFHSHRLCTVKLIVPPAAAQQLKKTLRRRNVEASWNWVQTSSPSAKTTMLQASLAWGLFAWHWPACWMTKAPPLLCQIVVLRPQPSQSMMPACEMMGLLRLLLRWQTKRSTQMLQVGAGLNPRQFHWMQLWHQVDQGGHPSHSKLLLGH